MIRRGHQEHSLDCGLDLEIDMTGKETWALWLSECELCVEWTNLLESLQSTSRLKKKMQQNAFFKNILNKFFVLHLQHGQHFHFITK